MKIISRILEVIFYGAIIEIIVSFLLCIIFNEQSTIGHLKSVFEANTEYLDSSLFVSSVIFNPTANHVINPVVNWLLNVGGHFSESNGMVSFMLGYLIKLINLMGYALGLFMQKVLIAFISVPVFGIFVLVGTYDGIIQRELRRYRVGIESTKREKFETGVKWTTRCAFVGYVSIPLYIPAPIWFMGWGIATAILMQMTMSFVQKYI